MNQSPVELRNYLVRIGLYKPFGHFEAFVHELSILLLPPPSIPALLTLLQYYCTTIAQYTTPLDSPPLCMPHTVQYW